MAKEQPKARLADVFAGKGSLLDKLRKKRIETEQNIPGEQSADDKPSKEDHKRGYTQTSMNDNS